MSRDFVRITGGPTRFEELEPCTPSTEGCYEHDELAELAEQVTKYKGFFPLETLATFRVDDDVSLQTLVSLIDLVRGGEACELSDAMTGAGIPEACSFWQASLDHDPPAVGVDDMDTPPHEPPVDAMKTAPRSRSRRSER